MAEREYIRLARPRLKSGFQVAAASRSSLWLGKDHLLCVETTGYTETYKRFYFRDIQACALRTNRRRLVFNIVLGVPVALFALVIVLAWLDISSRPRQSDDMLALLFWGGLMGIFLSGMLVNHLRGPGCVFTLRTAVQEEEISALKRVKQVQKVLAHIRPLIAEAQGLLAREEIPARLAELAAQDQPHLVVDDPNLPPRMVG